MKYSYRIKFNFEVQLSHQFSQFDPLVALQLFPLVSSVATGVLTLFNCHKLVALLLSS